MGGRLSTTEKYVSGAEKVLKNVQEGITDVGTQVARRVKKPTRQFMASERAEKVLDAQSEIPKRAPMNLGKVDIHEAVRKKRLEELEKMQQKDKEYLTLMKDVFVTSEDASEGDPQQTDPLKKPLPTRKEKVNLDQSSEVPRGCALNHSIILALYNNKMNPEDWGAVEIAEKINIRESDAKDILDHFELLDNKSVFQRSIKRLENV